MKSRSFASHLLVFITFILGVLVIAACIAPFIPVIRVPILSLISLGLPLLIAAYLLCFVFWLLFKKRYRLLVLVPVVLTLLVHGSIVRYNPDAQQLLEDHLKVLSFNTRAFNRFQFPAGENNADEILNFITEANPDIACFQEFSYPESSKLSQYPHQYVDYPIGEPPRVVTAILSKYPILDKGRLIFENSVNNAIWADIAYKNDTIRVYSIHLESLRLNPNPEGLLKEAQENKFQRVGRSFMQQQDQADKIVAHAAETDAPKLFCGDFNNSPFSNIYRKLKRGMEDSFREAGSGFGSTYSLFFLPLRIDFILAGEEFEITGHKTFQENLSDHKPIMSSMVLEVDD